MLARDYEEEEVGSCLMDLEFWFCDRKMFF
jgi:hypothetical protein